MTSVRELVVESDEVHGQGGFLAVRRVRLRNRREDGSLSEPYICDFLSRSVGADAVVVAVFRRVGTSFEVLLREGLRPALVLGRDPARVPVPDRDRPLLFGEVVAGILEREDRGADGIRRRAALEVAEEVGFTVDPGQVFFLGAGCFPSPGAMSEKFWLTAVEVHSSEPDLPADGDGSPMEEGARSYWRELDAAIAAGVAGELEDAKTELILRRLRDHLRAAP
jgi:ADP-ribose pyrophosphatase